MKEVIKRFKYLIYAFILLIAILHHSLFMDSSIIEKGERLSENANIVTHSRKLTESGKIVVTEENYLEILTEIFFYFEGYHGVEIEVEGFVYRNEDYERNQFMVARVLTSCCAAHGEVTGLFCYWDGEINFEEETWVRVTGTLQSLIYYDEEREEKYEVPVIIVTDLVKLPQPKEAIIYL